MLDSSDYAMHTWINGVELIVFTSKWLEMTCAGELYTPNHPRFNLGYMFVVGSWYYHLLFEN